MRGLRHIPVILVILSAVSCGGSSAHRQGRMDDCCFKCIPSDAVMVAGFNHLEDGLKILLDSAHVLRSVDFAPLSGSRMSFAYDYSKSLNYILTVDVGKQDRDTIPSGVVTQSVRKGLLTNVCEVDGRLMLVIASSDNMMRQSKEHIAAGTSVMEAPGFRELVTDEPFIAVKNTEAAYFTPRNWEVFEYIQRRRLLKFLSKVSQWTVFHPQKDNSFRIRMDGGEGDGYFSKVLDFWQGTESCIGRLLPSETECVLDLCFNDWKEYADAFAAFTDMSNRPVPGKKALEWAASVGVKELAVIVFGGGKRVTALRASVSPDDFSGNFSSAVFGPAFDAGPEASSVVFDKWVLSGPQDVLDSFVMSVKKQPEDWPEQKLKAVLMCRNVGMLVCGESCNELKLY